MTDTATEVRFDLIDREIAWAEAETAKGELSAWNQQMWVVGDAPCGTAFCIAGHVAHDAKRAEGADFDPGDLVIDGEHVSAIAANVLGLEVVEGPEYAVDARLFHAYNSLGDLKRHRDDYAEQVGEPRRYAPEEYRDDRGQELDEDEDF